MYRAIGSIPFVLRESASTSFSCGRSTHNSYRFHDFSVFIPSYSKDVYVNRIFPHTARFWNSNSSFASTSPKTYDLNCLGSDSTVNTFSPCLLLTKIWTLKNCNQNAVADIIFPRLPLFGLFHTVLFIQYKLKLLDFSILQCQNPNQLRTCFLLFLKLM